uniref:hypothetical protein n=1 Tax=Yoonia sp. TaxID=2212373 RepID=UPI004047451D
VSPVRGVLEPPNKTRNPKYQENPSFLQRTSLGLFSPYLYKEFIGGVRVFQVRSHRFCAVACG